MSERARSMGLTGTFHERKAHRKSYNEKYVYGWKERPCGACNGSGHYDHNGSPACGACDGTGKERYKPEGLAKLAESMTEFMAKHEENRKLVDPRDFYSDALQNKKKETE